MKLIVNLIFCVASVTFGTVCCPTNPAKQEATVSVPPPSSDREVVFGGGRLRTAVDEVLLKNNRLQYSIDVSYPQVLGSDDRHIRKLNQRIEYLATKQYQWPLSPSKKDLRYYREKWSDAFNTVDVDYEVRSATDSFLSIYFVGYSYGIGAGHSVQYSFVVNYDLSLKRELKLSDIFQRRSKYVEYISRYCRNELSRKSEFLFTEALAPKAKNFKSWNISSEGIRFNFDACTVFACSEGEQTVVIPFADLKPFLNRRLSPLTG